ncbi:MAG: hypothetical protein AAF328_09995 [Planctomycetota bacterium]
MPDELTTHAPATEPAEPMIRQWSDQLRWLPAERRDELEDHLRNELRTLDSQALTPRERVIIAADRLGQPLLPASHVGAFRLTPRFGLAFAAVFVLTPILMQLAGHGTWELVRELDDDDWFGETGDQIQDALNGMAPAVVMTIVLAVGVFFAWKLVQRQRRLA